MKIEKTGWVAKDFSLKRLKDQDNLKAVRLIKGTAKDWSAFAWPPKKVRITIEDVEK